MPRRTRLLATAAVCTAAIFPLTGCVAGASAEHAYAPRAAIGAAPPADAVELPDGSVEAALEDLPGIVEDVLDRTGVPGAAVAVVRGDELLYAEGFGVRRVGEEGGVDESSVFQIASMSKPIGATVVATQVTAGVVDWDTPVAPLLPGFALADPWVTEHLTVGDLYSHRSGLPLAAGDDLEDIGYDREYILDHLRYQPLDPFRSTYHYANFGMTTGAQAVANAAGVTWEELSEQQLYRPLGMTSTSSRYEDFIAHENRASLHAKVGDRFEALYERQPDAQSPAGGVSSNVVDLAKWIGLVLGGGTLGEHQLVAPEVLATVGMPHATSAPSGDLTMRSGSYGYGFNVGVQESGRPALSHSGAFVTGAGTNVQIVPALDLGIVALTNGAPVGAAESITAEFLDRVQFGEPTRDWLAAYGPALSHYDEPAGDLVGEEPPAAAAPARPLDEYAGTWSNEYFGDAIVEVDAGALVVRLGPGGGYTVELEHWDGDVFAYVPHGENAPAGSQASATFALGGAGGDELNLQFFDANGLGTWTR